MSVPSANLKIVQTTSKTINTLTAITLEFKTVNPIDKDATLEITIPDELDAS
jgi:hypothetical protein